MSELFSLLFFIRSLLYLQGTRTCKRAQMSLTFDRIRPQTVELAALECQNLYGENVVNTVEALF